MRPIVLQARGESAAWVPPTSRVLAYFHGGRIFTDTLPLVARIGVVVFSLFFALSWIVQWETIFRDYERWSLIRATLVQFAFLALTYFFYRIAWLRIDHLRRLPASDDVALRSLPILLRLAAELSFIFWISLALVALLMPGVPAPQALEADTWSLLEQVMPNPYTRMAVGVGLTMWIALFTLFAVLLLYGLANAVETYLAIEQNTRSFRRKDASHEDFVGRHDG